MYVQKTTDEVAQEAEQSRTAYQELLVKYRALQRELHLLNASNPAIDTENAPEPYIIVLVDAHSHMVN
jgi:hypothetical protein